MIMSSATASAPSAASRRSARTVTAPPPPSPAPEPAVGGRRRPTPETTSSTSTSTTSSSQEKDRGRAATPQQEEEQEEATAPGPAKSSSSSRSSVCGEDPPVRAPLPRTYGRRGGDKPSGSSKGKAMYDPSVPLSPGFKRAKEGSVTRTAGTTVTSQPPASQWESPPPPRTRRKPIKRPRVVSTHQAPSGSVEKIRQECDPVADDAGDIARVSTPVAVLSKDVWLPSLRKLRVVMDDAAEGSCVLMISADEDYGHRKRIEQLLAIVNDELGWSVQANATNGGEEKIFIFVSKTRQAVGCLVAEPVEQAFRVVGERGEECSTQPESAVMGISRIWVHEDHRRKGVATKLLDAARAHFAYGYMVRKSECAFTQPTRDGHSLATQYFGLAQFLVYK